MMKLLTTLLLLLACLLPAATPPLVRAGHLSGAITLDGRLDEPAWQGAGVINGLTQQEPHPGEPTPYATVVKILVGRDRLYVGITCTDPDLSRIAIHTMQRDGNMNGDDNISIVFDPLNTRRRGYLFVINAAGARMDGLISGPEDFSTDWDGIWDVRTRRTPTGWTAEMELPALSLHFKEGVDQWGFNVERTIARDRTTVRWCGTSLDARLVDLRRSGILKGMKDLRQKMGLSVTPYGVARSTQDLVEDHNSLKGEAGGEVTWNITPDLAGIVTINTDFAETEVDTRQVNLSRFPLFFPEKRDFFLEGSNLFTFGSGLGEDFIPFYSRRIGLYEGEEMPLNGGVKVLGETSRWGLALLDVKTGGTSAAPGSNLFAGRFKLNLTEHLSIGTIVTDGNPDGIHDNTLSGADILYQTSTFHGDKNLSLGGWAAWSGGDIPEGRRSAWGFQIDYPNDLWDVFFLVKEFGDGLDPALGFLTRPGTRWYEGGGAFQPRPRGGIFDRIRQFYFETYVTYIEGLDGRCQSWRVFMAPFNVQTESGEHLEANIAPQYEYLEEPFEIAEGVIIPPGTYHFTRYRVEAQSSRHRPWRVGGTVWFGDFYTGRLAQWENFLTWSSGGGHLQLTLEAENDYAHLPEGDFIQRLWQIKSVYAFTPNLILSSYLQYDSESRDLGSNTRLRWTIHPGRDLFVVWNHGWKHPIGAESRFALSPAADQIVVKLKWTFRR